MRSPWHTDKQPVVHPPAGGGASEQGKLAHLIAAAREALPDPDLTDQQLRRGGEEGLTDAQLGR